ncbi:hypothetical protein FIV42_00555 [Persicimonas caeni]|uniref:HNH endonuclease n=1 Tax=Persicimonas caeni TaxID=2292766 RepID=A0A4Y6PN97_PERCE|nr:hypothetical protein [Persicimonas caeni]QDG49275.1 hypothetical protein FIV42_00555 [Persicimonas caeni]QED30496.1 hypothetical protein FRD00_00550 [Persicimonas caeni]
METCAFCQKRRSLEESHIIPKAVGRAAKRRLLEEHPTFVTTSGERNVQDIDKLDLLCRECERLHAELGDDPFLRYLFHPFFGQPVGLSAQENSERLAFIKYGEWLRRFAASVSWRVIAAASKRGELSDEFGPADLRRIGRAKQVWKQYLNGRRDDVGPFHHYALPLHVVFEWELLDVQPSSYLNRFLGLSFHTAVKRVAGTLCTYVKMPRFIFIGKIHPTSATAIDVCPRIHADGTLRLDGWHTLPEALLRYLNEQAEWHSQAHDNPPEYFREKSKANAQRVLRKRTRDEIFDSDEIRLFAMDEELQRNWTKASPLGLQSASGSDQ